MTLRLLLHRLMATLLLMCFGWSDALAQEPGSACEVCVSRQVVAQCKADAVQIDATRARLRSCQRDLDARSGESGTLSEQLAALQAAHLAETARRAEEIAMLRQRPR